MAKRLRIFFISLQCSADRWKIGKLHRILRATVKYLVKTWLLFEKWQISKLNKNHLGRLLVLGAADPWSWWSTKFRSNLLLPKYEIKSATWQRDQFKRRGFTLQLVGLTLHVAEWHVYFRYLIQYYNLITTYFLILRSILYLQRSVIYKNIEIKKKTYTQTLPPLGLLLFILQLR